MGIRIFFFFQNIYYTLTEKFSFRLRLSIEDNSLCPVTLTEIENP